MPPRKRVKKVMEGDQESPDYYPEVDPFEDMDIEGMLEPEPKKQIPIQPPSYSEVMDEEFPDYGLQTEDEDEITEAESEEETDEDTAVADEITSEDFNLPSLEVVEDELADRTNKTYYLKGIIKQATHERIKGFQIKQYETIK